MYRMEKAHPTTGKYLKHSKRVRSDGTIFNSFLVDTTKSPSQHPNITTDITKFPALAYFSKDRLALRPLPEI